MKIDAEKVRSIFSYHPAKADETRAQKHRGWNELVLNFVLQSANYIEISGDYVVFLRQMQEIRMLGNQTIVNKTLGIKYKDVIEDDNAY